MRTPPLRPQLDKNIAEVCDLCGGEPKCVKYCMQKALIFLKPEEYDNFLTKTKIPTMRGESWFIKDFKTWKIDKVLASAVSEPEGKLPAEPPYQYVAKIEVSDLDAMVKFLGTEGGKQLIKSWSVYMDPAAIFTLGREM